MSSPDLPHQTLELQAPKKLENSSKSLFDILAQTITDSWEQILEWNKRQNFIDRLVNSKKTNRWNPEFEKDFFVKRTTPDQPALTAKDAMSFDEQNRTNNEYLISLSWGRDYRPTTYYTWKGVVMGSYPNHTITTKEPSFQTKWLGEGLVGGIILKQPKPQTKWLGGVWSEKIITKWWEQKLTWLWNKDDSKIEYPFKPSNGMFDSTSTLTRVNKRAWMNPDIHLSANEYL